MTEMMLAHTGDADSRTSMSDAILDGYAPDGELYVPTDYPTISDRELYALQGADYSTIFYEVTKKFLEGAIPDDELRRIAKEAYGPEAFDFDDGRLRTQQLPSGLHIVGLSDGPTGAFKDMAMQPFAKWVEVTRKAKGIEKLLEILAPTTGDTGPAAQHAFGQIENTRTAIMFPKGATSSMQHSQMVAMHNGDNIHSLEVSHRFTELNNIQMRANEVFEFGAVNSANIARLIAQVAYHVAAYLQAIEKSGAVFGDPVDISIPSGNFGNGLAAIIARKMGVPIRNIIVATDENDILSQYFNEKKYPHLSEADEVRTTSSAQGIRNSSNWWRLADMLYGGKNREIYAEWKKEGSVVDLAKYAIRKSEYIRDVKATSVTEIARQAMMQTVWDETKGKVMIDPHTANAVVGAITQGDVNRDTGKFIIPTVAYETAKPWKFPEVMKDVLREEPEVPERHRDMLHSAKGKVVPHAENEQEVLEYLESIGVARRAV